MHVGRQLLEKLKTEFHYGFEQLDGKMKDLASRISGMAVNVEYKRQSLLLDYEMKADELRESTEGLQYSVDAINDRIDQAIVRICDDHKQDIINLIDEQSRDLGDILMTQQETFEAIKEGREESMEQFDLLNDAMDVTYSSVLDTLEMINVLHNKILELQHSTNEIDAKTDEILQQGHEAKAMLGDMSALLVGIMGQAKKNNAENRNYMDRVQRFVSEVMGNLSEEMDTKTETLYGKLNNILDAINQPAEKYRCPWCKREELVTTEHKEMLRCGHCGQIVSSKAYLDNSFRIPELRLVLDGKDWYYQANEMTENDDTVVVNISSGARMWLNDEKISAVVEKDFSMSSKLKPRTIILVSDFECLLNIHAVRKLRHKLGDLNKIIIGAGILSVKGEEKNPSWRFDKSKNQYVRKQIRK